MDKIVEPLNNWEQSSIEISLAKQWHRNGGGRRNEKVHHVSDLTFMTRFDKPCYIVLQSRPPESV